MDSADQDKDSSVEENKNSKGNTSKSRVITTELAILLYVMYYSPNMLLSQQYILSEVSKEYNYSTKDSNESACLNAGEHTNLTSLQMKVQGKSSQVMLVLGLSSSLLSIFSTLFLGAYSDSRGRKVSLLIPLGGALCKCTAYTVVVRFNLPYWYLVIGAVLDGFGGFWTAFLMACFAYIADISATANRTLRITILEVCTGVAMACSNFASGYLIAAVGYLYSFIILFCMNIANIVYIVFVLPEPKLTREKPSIGKVLSASAKIYMKDEPNKRRWKLQLVTLIMVVTGMVSLAKYDTQTYFLRGRPLCFSPVQVGYFTGGFNLAQNLGSLLAVALFGRKLGDMGILILGCIFGIITMAYFAFVQNIWMVSLGMQAFTIFFIFNFAI